MDKVKICVSSCFKFERYPFYDNSTLYLNILLNASAYYYYIYENRELIFTHVFIKGNHEINIVRLYNNSFKLLTTVPYKILQSKL